MHIAIDLMGGDTAPAELFKAVALATRRLPPDVALLLLATPAVVEELEPLAESLPISFQPTAEAISMEDSPLSAVRRKKNSSLMVGMALLKERRVDALITSSNSGALIAAATLLLPMLPTMQRAALMALLPRHSGVVAVADVGGNMRCRTPHLLQFARFGASYQRCRFGVKLPKVGLLNIGEEPLKGPKELQNSYRALGELATTASFEFTGNVEGNELFSGEVDVLVTDGFTGNVLLKSAEGASGFLLEELKSHLATAPHSGDIATFEEDFHRTARRGAIVCGIDALLIKWHGKAPITALYNAIEEAVKLLKMGLLEKLYGDLSRH